MIVRWIFLLFAMIPAMAIAAEHELGRLFFTPAERARLDTIRDNSKPPEKTDKLQEAEDTSIITGDAVQTHAAPPVVTLQGFVKRSDGKSTVWINGKPIQEKTTENNITVGPLKNQENQVQLKFPSGGGTVKMKAGQSYDAATGKLVDSVTELPTRNSRSSTTNTAPGKHEEKIDKKTPSTNIPEEATGQ